MNKKLIAVAVAGIVAAPAAYADASIYGRIHNRIVSSDSDTNLQTSGSRFGVNVSSDIGNGMTAIGKYEWGTDTDTAGDLKTREAYVGLSGGFGTLTIGRQFATYYKTIGAYMSPTSYVGLRPIGITGHTSNDILYTNSLGPVTLYADIRVDDSEDPDLNAKGDPIHGQANGGAVGFSVSPMEGLTLGAAFDSTDDGADVTGVMASAGFGGVGITIAHEQLDDGNPGDNDEATSIHMSFSATDSLSLMVGYGTSEDGVTGVSPDTFMAGAYYGIGGGLRLHAEYASYDEDDGEDNTSSAVVGIRIDF